MYEYKYLTHLGKKTKKLAGNKEPTNGDAINTCVLNLKINYLKIEILILNKTINLIYHFKYIVHFTEFKFPKIFK